MNKYLSAVEKEYFREKLREFEDTVPMTHPERTALRRWVRSGHDINSNPWGYCYGNGWELSYLEALRIDITEYELIKEMADES